MELILLLLLFKKIIHEKIIFIKELGRVEDLLMKEKMLIPINKDQAQEEKEWMK